MIEKVSNVARPAYSQEQVRKMCGLFVEVTRQIIKEEGIAKVTIRNVSSKAGYNSATLYHYFRDLDHLLAFTSLSFFREYYDNLNYYASHITDKYTRFIAVWELFCDCTLKNPLVFHKFFFGKYAENFGSNIAEYYHIFPEQLPEKMDEVIKDMILGKTLSERNITILEPLCKLGYLEENDLEIVNQLVILSYKEILSKKMTLGEEIDNLTLINEFDRALDYLLKKQ